MNYSHGGAVEERKALRELRDKLDRDLISLSEYFRLEPSLVNEILKELYRNPILDFEELEYPVVGESSSVDEYSIRQCTRLPEGNEIKSTFGFVMTSSNRLDYWTNVSLSPVPLIRD